MIASFLPSPRRDGIVLALFPQYVPSYVSFVGLQYLPENIQNLDFGGPKNGGSIYSADPVAGDAHEV
jgi:hypothetical protein